MIWLAVGLFVVLLAALAWLGRLYEWHHGYYGFALCALVWIHGWPVEIELVGLVLLFDDDVQHVVEAVGLRPRMADFTPIHKVGAWLVSLFTKD